MFFTVTWRRSGFLSPCRTGGVDLLGVPLFLGQLGLDNIAHVLGDLAGADIEQDERRLVFSGDLADQLCQRI